MIGERLSPTHLIFSTVSFPWRAEIIMLGFGTIDFEGQKLAEKIYQLILNVFGILALVVGFGTESVYNLWMTMGAGVLLACVICLPSWPFYRRTDLSWQPLFTESSLSETKKAK